MDPIERVVTEIRQQVVDVGAIVDGVVNRMKSVLGEAIGAVFEPLAAALQGIMGLVAQLVAGLLGDLATPADVVDQAIRKWSEAKLGDRSVIDALLDWLTRAVPDAAGTYLSNHVNLTLDPAFGVDQREPGSPPTIGEYRERVTNAPGILKAMHNLAAAILVIGAYAQMEHSANLAALQQDVAIHDPVTPLGSPELATAVVQNVVETDWAKQQALRLGLTPELFDIIVRTTGEPLGAQQMLELWRRGKVTEEQVDQALRESRLKNQYIAALKELRFVVAPPSDLIRFLVRDAFDKNVAEDLQTDTDFDKKFDAAAFFEVGLSEEIARRYWRAHWQLPSPTQLFEMHHRTSDEATYKSEPVQLPSGRTVHRLISQEFLRDTLKINDLLPPFLDKYRAISFDPLTRVDARRMFASGILDVDGLFRTYLDEGYNDVDARRLTDWQVKVKEAAEAADRAKHYAPVITQIRDYYREGLVNNAEATAQLTELEVPADIIELWLRAEDLVRTRRRSSAVRDGLHRLYVGGFITEEEARSRLATDGYTAEQLVYLFEDWHVDLEFREHGDEAKQARELTKGNVIDAYKERAIGREEATSLLTALHHSADVVEFWLADADRDEAKRVNDILKEAIHADYVDEQIDRPDASAQLDAIGLTAENREALLRRWSVERRRKEPNLSPAQIEAGFKARVVDESTVREMLHNLRYADDEVSLLVAVWSEEVSIAEQRLELSRQQFAFRQAESEQARSDRLAREQRQTEAQLARENRTEQSRLVREQRSAAAEQTRHDRNVQDKLEAEQRATAQREVARSFTAELQNQRLSAADARQARSIDSQIAAAQQREAAAEKRQQSAISARIEAEQRRTEAQIDRENRQEQARIRSETRAQQYKIATEGRGERRQLEKEARALQSAQTREERAQADRVAIEQRQAQRNAVVQASMAQANQQIEELRRAESDRLRQSATDRQAQLQDALARRISALQ